jgi:hypothetical protein
MNSQADTLDAAGFFFRTRSLQFDAHRERLMRTAFLSFHARLAAAFLSFCSGVIRAIQSR